MTPSAQIKAIVRELTGQRKVRASFSRSGWLNITLFEPASNETYQKIMNELVARNLVGSYIGDFTPSVQPRLPSCSIFVEEPT